MNAEFGSPRISPEFHTKYDLVKWLLLVKDMNVTEDYVKFVYKALKVVGEI